MACNKKLEKLPIFHGTNEFVVIFGNILKKIEGFFVKLW